MKNLFFFPAWTFGNLWQAFEIEWKFAKINRTYLKKCVCFASVIFVNLWLTLANAVKIIKHTQFTRKTKNNIYVLPCVDLWKSLACAGHNMENYKFPQTNNEKYVLFPAWLIGNFWLTLAGFGRRCKLNEQLQNSTEKNDQSLFFPAWIFGNVWLTFASVINLM